jgi:CheY-like chemotaxis protein
VAEGLAQLRDSSPDVVLLDLNLPEMDGFTFLDRLASASGSRLPPIVVLTSMALDRDNRARLLGVSRVLSKSELSTPNLIEAIKMATQQTAEDNPRWH